MASARLVSKLHLATKPHPRPYKLQWLSKDGEVQVRHQVEVDVSIGKYNDKVLCDGFPMEANHLLLGRPWQFDNRANHDGYTNKISFMHLNQTFEWKVMTTWISRELPLYFSECSIYDGPQSYTRVKCYGHLNLPRAFVFNFERLDMLCAWIRHPSEKLWPLEFLESFRCTISSTRYMMGLNHTPELEVMTVWICREYPCSISSVSI